MALLFVLWVHILAAGLWIGSMVCSRLILTPLLRGRRTVDAAVIAQLDQRFKTLRWVSLVTLVVTGLYNLLQEGGSGRLAASWGGIILIKILFVFIAMILTGVNDYVLVPSARAGSASRAVDWMDRVILAVSLLILWLAVYLAAH